LSFFSAGDALLEDPVATLGVRAGLAERRKRGGHFDPAESEVGDQVGLSRQGQDREVAAVDDPPAELRRLIDQESELRVQLGGTPRDVEDGDVVAAQQLDDLAGGSRDIASRRSGPASTWQ
jgi:hypothetical protein